MRLVEILIAMIILAMVLAAGLPFAADFYMAYQLDSEQRILVSILEQARNLAMVNYQEARHGIYLAASKFVVFQGPNFSARDVSQDKNFPRSSAVAVSGFSEVVFEQLSGRTSSTTIILDNGQKSRLININEEGLISF